MKKLIPTIGMALLSAAMLGTSTFAWFSANSTATATGLHISAKASSSLLVSNTSNSGFSASTTLAPDNRGDAEDFVVEPATHDASYAFKKLSADAKEHVGTNGQFLSDYTPDETTYVSTTYDYMHDEIFMLYAGGESGGIVTAKATLSNASPIGDTIWKAVHVDMVDKDGAQAAHFEFSALGTAVTAANQLSVSSTGETKYDIYMWVEGTDPDCYNGAALNGEGYSLSFEFTIAE